MEIVTIKPEDEVIIRAAMKLGIADELAVRNLRIRHDYHSYPKGTPYSQKLVKLSKKYHIGTNAIERVIYNISKKKKVSGC
ncbi:MAG: hypothetical protein K1X86_16815 [Ignavibacteria bacterium]|nr:hypothetical protein [Ignavibacteria bacterium]